LSGVGLLRHQVRYDALVFRRNYESVFYVVGLPLLYLVVFVALWGDEQMPWQVEGQAAGPLTVSSYMVASFLSIGIVSAGFLDSLIVLVQQRESGLLERLGTTPLPRSVHLMARCTTSVLLALMVAVVLLVTARVVYEVPVPLENLLALAVTVVVGALCTTCVAFATTAAVRRARAVTPVGLGATLALFFLSGNFFLVEDPPAVMRVVRDVFPVGHLNDALLTALNPNSTGGGWHPAGLAVLALWGLAGALLAARVMRWSPHRG
jgi:ABC-2 type transport system permease protein